MSEGYTTLHCVKKSQAVVVVDFDIVLVRCVFSSSVLIILVVEGKGRGLGKKMGWWCGWEVRERGEGEP